MPPDNPFQPPSQVDEPQSRRYSPIYIMSCLLWTGLAIKQAVIRPTIGSFFEDFGVELPTLTLYLLHPMSTVLLFATAAAVIFAGLIAKSPEDRNRVGRIGALLALIALAALAFGFGLPAWQLYRALQFDVP